MKKFLFPDTSSLPASVGLLALRLVVGIAMTYHGQSKIANPFHWMDQMDPNMPGFLQALAAVSEFFGGIALVLGLLTPLVALGIVCTMAVATWKLHGMGGTWLAPDPKALTFELSFVYLAVGLLFLFAGPGALSLDALLFNRKRRGGSVIAGH